jgi:hypothetical protein
MIGFSIFFIFLRSGKTPIGALKICVFRFSKKIFVLTIKSLFLPPVLLSLSGTQFHVLVSEHPVFFYATMLTLFYVVNVQ